MGKEKKSIRGLEQKFTSGTSVPEKPNESTLPRLTNKTGTAKSTERGLATTGNQLSRRERQQTSFDVYVVTMSGKAAVQPRARCKKRNDKQTLETGQVATGILSTVRENYYSGPTLEPRKNPAEKTTSSELPTHSSACEGTYEKVHNSIDPTTRPERN